MSKLNKTENPLEDLIISMLSVNNVSVERTYSFIDSMRKEGLFEPSNLEKWSIEDIGNNLKKAGYDRGGVNYILAERLSALGKLISSKGKKEFEKELANPNETTLRDFLISIKGVGNKVIENFFILRGLE